MHQASSHLILKFPYYYSILQMRKPRPLREVSDLPMAPQLVSGGDQL